MDYSGASFDSQWDDNHLYVHIKQWRKDALPLLKIVIDAAMAQGEFCVTWDLRHLERPPILEWFGILSFVDREKRNLDKHTEKVVLLVAPRFIKWWTMMMETMGPGCTYLVTTEANEAKFFMS
tara:strand:- start:495 stop:863 length:369 start_codon:yes stop_codon:yes gene_type:complete